MTRRFRAAVATAIAAAIGLMLVSAAASAPAAPALDCRAIANMPRTAFGTFTHPPMIAWGEFRCASHHNLAIRACRVRLGAPAQRRFPAGVVQGTSGSRSPRAGG